MGHLNKEEAQIEEDEQREVAEVMLKARRQVAIDEARKRLREKLVQRPKDVDTKAAEEFAQRRIIEMLPDAVAEVEFQLKYGDDAQRISAARDILDANGMRKREQIQGGGNTIIMQISGGLPWDKALQVTAAKALDAVVTKREVGEREETQVHQHVPELVR